jgi:hypothetical protein
MASAGFAGGPPRVGRHETLRAAVTRAPSPLWGRRGGTGPCDESWRAITTTASPWCSIVASPSGRYAARSTDRHRRRASHDRGRAGGHVGADAPEHVRATRVWTWACASASSRAIRPGSACAVLDLERLSRIQTAAWGSLGCALPGMPSCSREGLCAWPMRAVNREEQGERSARTVARDAAASGIQPELSVLPNLSPDDRRALSPCGFPSNPPAIVIGAARCRRWTGVARRRKQRPAQTAPQGTCTADLPNAAGSPGDGVAIGRQHCLDRPGRPASDVGRAVGRSRRAITMAGALPRRAKGRAARSSPTLRARAKRGCGVTGPSSLATSARGLAGAPVRCAVGFVALIRDRRRADRRAPPPQCAFPEPYGRASGRPDPCHRWLPRP